MLPLPPQSILFAPMEGYTDPAFRSVISELFPHWDLLYTYFLRIPGQQTFSPKIINEHLGQSNHPSGTILQILAPAHSPLIEQTKIINDMGLPWIDLNLGCPSKKVNGHKGGSYLLQDLPILKEVLLKIRLNFSGTFTAKIRTGYNDTRDFEAILRLLSDCGLDGITIHARTKAQQYNGPADWSYIQKAVELIPVPIIGNGDIWCEDDAIKMLDTTRCHSVMVARGALKTPWMGKRYRELKQGSPRSSHLEERDYCLPLFLNSLVDVLQKESNTEAVILKRIKSVSRYIFDDYPNAQERKHAILRSQSLQEVSSFLSRFFGHKIRQYS